MTAWYDFQLFLPQWPLTKRLDNIFPSKSRRWPPPPPHTHHPISWHDPAAWIGKKYGRPHRGSLFWMRLHNSIGFTIFVSSLKETPKTLRFAVSVKTLSTPIHNNGQKCEEIGGNVEWNTCFFVMKSPKKHENHTRCRFRSKNHHTNWHWGKSSVWNYLLLLDGANRLPGTGQRGGCIERSSVR